MCSEFPPFINSEIPSLEVMWASRASVVARSVKSTTWLRQGGVRGLAKKKGGGFKAGNKGGGRKGGDGGEAKGMVEAYNRFVEVAEEAKKFKPNFSEEELKEHERIAKEYQRQSSIRHNKLEKDLSTKIWLQQEALRAIPSELFEHATTVDDTPPPANRPWPFYATPPIKGFDPKSYLKVEGDDDDDEEDDEDVMAAGGQTEKV